MIFATVGMQLPFPRLMKALALLPPGEPIFAQTGPDCGNYPFATVVNLSPGDWAKRARDSRVIVAHAGMGTVLMAIKIGKPLVVVPRDAGLGEHRNNHQKATARKLARRDGIYVVWNPAELGAVLHRPLETPTLGLHRTAHQKLIENVREFLA